MATQVKSKCLKIVLKYSSWGNIYMWLLSTNGLSSVCQSATGTERIDFQLWSHAYSSQERNVFFDTRRRVWTVKYGINYTYCYVFLNCSWMAADRITLPVLVFLLYEVLLGSTPFWIGPNYPRVYSDLVFFYKSFYACWVFGWLTTGSSTQMNGLKATQRQHQFSPRLSHFSTNKSLYHPNNVNNV